LHKDLELLNSIHKFFKVGAVSISGKIFARYRVRSREELKIIIEHFKNHPLQTSKAIHFAYFCEILNSMNSKTHTGNLGFLKLVSLINRLNKFAFFAIFVFLIYGFDLNLFGKSFILTFIPAVTYLNADLQKDKIILENKNKSGVYCWINLANNKIYIRSSTNLGIRLSDYYDVKQLMIWNGLISRALLKYGYSSFKLDILEYYSSEDVIKREEYYIDNLQPEYNILKKVGSSCGYKHTDEARLKISTAK